MTVEVTFPNGVTWRRDFTAGDECLRRSRGESIDYDADVTRSMARQVLTDSGLFTDAEAYYFTEDSAQRLAVAIEALRAK